MAKGHVILANFAMTAQFSGHFQNKSGIHGFLCHLGGGVWESPHLLTQGHIFHLFFWSGIFGG